jgi:hypothetical protein
MTRTTPARLAAQAPLLGAAAASRPETIRDFLRGRSDGEVLLHGMYDHVLEERVPDKLVELVDAPLPEAE